jgi:DNA-binding Xre family transcriptional regulator
MTRIQEALFKKRMTQSDLYNRIVEISEVPVTRAMLSRICTGRQKNYHTNTLLKICFALEVSPNDILEPKEYLHLFKEDFVQSLSNEFGIA